MDWVNWTQKQSIALYFAKEIYYKPHTLSSVFGVYQQEKIGKAIIEYLNLRVTILELPS